MSERVEAWEAKCVVSEVDDGGDTGLSVYLTAGTGISVEIAGSESEITKFATDLIAALILRGDVG